MFIHGVSPNISRIEGVFATISQEYPSSPIPQVQRIQPIQTDTENHSQNSFDHATLQRSAEFSTAMIRQMNKLVYHTDQPKPQRQVQMETVGSVIDKSA